MQRRKYWRQTPRTARLRSSFESMHPIFHLYLCAVINMSLSEHSNTAIATALDETFVLLKRLTDQIKAQESRLHSIALPDDTRSLAFVRAILKHNLAPSKTTHLVKSLRDMRGEIQTCLRKLGAAFQHPWRLYTAMSNGLARVATNETTSRRPPHSPLASD